MFIGLVMSTLNKFTEEKKSRYEDISRILIGSKAYLLFDFQNIIVDVSFLSTDKFRHLNLFKHQFWPLRKTKVL